MGTQELTTKTLEEWVTLLHAVFHEPMHPYTVACWKRELEYCDFNDSEITHAVNYYFGSTMPTPSDLVASYEEFMKEVNTELHRLKIRTEIGGVWKK